MQWVRVTSHVSVEIWVLRSPTFSEHPTAPTLSPCQWCKEKKSQQQSQFLEHPPIGCATFMYIHKNNIYIFYDICMYDLSLIIYKAQVFANVINLLPVEPHEAVAEVSKIGNV